MLTVERIDQLVKDGKLTPEQATQAKAALQAPVRVTPAPIEATPTIYTPPARRGTLFDHTYEEEHFERRLDVKEGVNHSIGLVCYGIIGFFDGIIDSAFFAAGELVEDVTFGVTRILYRARDGINRGKT